MNAVAYVWCYNIFMRKIVFFLVLTAVCVVPRTASAQVQPLILNLSTEFPKPGEVVSFYVDSYILDLNTSVIKWTVNGVVRKEKVGDRSIEVTAGLAGSTNSVDVEVITRDGRVINEGIVFYPAEVVLLWETDGYIPPFYKGGAPYLLGSTIKLTALPEFFVRGVRMDPKNLVYTWKNYFSEVPEASGYGKNTFEINDVSYLRPTRSITVEVSAPGGIPAGSATVTIGPKSPQLVFYEKSPLEGILFNKALEKSVLVSDNEVSLYATPYFFTSPNLFLPNLTLEWLVDGFPAEGYENANEIVLVKKPGQSGTSNLLVNARLPGNILQSASKDISLVVGN